MEEYSIVQGQTVLELLFALVSALIASYVFFSWKASPISTRLWWTTHKSDIGTWVVPIVVWSVVVWTMLAVTIILLGES